jgi:hypothetical protein
VSTAFWGMRIYCTVLYVAPKVKNHAVCVFLRLRNSEASVSGVQSLLDAALTRLTNNYGRSGIRNSEIVPEISYIREAEVLPPVRVLLLPLL